MLSGHRPKQGSLVLEFMPPVAIAPLLAKLEMFPFRGSWAEESVVRTLRLSLLATSMNFLANKHHIGETMINEVRARAWSVCPDSSATTTWIGYNNTTMSSMHEIKAPSCKSKASRWAHMQWPYHRTFTCASDNILNFRCHSLLRAKHHNKNFQDFHHSLMEDPIRPYSRVQVYNIELWVHGKNIPVEFWLLY